MKIIDVERPVKKLRPDPIVATKVSRKIQKAFDHLATKNYRCTRAELLRAIFLDCLKRHKVEIK
tara:strand:- start:221 stop:412 length:192 start_codon:yes stop_codon:yes gene_type:complete